MTIRNGAVALVLVSFAIGLLPQVAEAQRRLLDRARQAAREIVAEEVLPTAEALLGNVASAVIDDGRFTAVATPWANSDGSASVGRASFGGSAYVEPAGNGFALAFCDDAQPHRMLAGFAVSSSAQRLMQMEDRLAARERDALGGTEEATVSPFVGDYPLGSNQVRGAVGGAHVRPQGEAEGSLRLTSVSDEVWVGTAILNLPSAQIGENADTESVQLAVAFRAKPVRRGEMPAGCRGTGTPARR